MTAFDIHRIQMLMSDIADRLYSLSTKPWGEGVRRDAPLHRLQKLTEQARADEHIFTQAMHQYRHYRPAHESERIVKRPVKPVRYARQAMELWCELKVGRRIRIKVFVAAITAFALCERACEYMDKGDIGGAFDLYQDALQHKAVLDGVQGAHHMMQIGADNSAKGNNAKSEQTQINKDSGYRLFEELYGQDNWKNRLVVRMVEEELCKKSAAYKWIKEYEARKKQQ